MQITIWIIAVLSLAIGYADAGTIISPLGITSEEVTVWAARKNGSGPYKTSGDVVTNSPGDWTHILANADASLSADRFAGYTGAGCVPPVPSTSLGAILPAGDRVRDAAFVYMVSGTLSYRTAALAELLAQVAEAGVDFNNTSKWCRLLNNTVGDNYFRTAMWATKIIYAYDYLRAGDVLHSQTLSGANQTTLETWILHAGEYFQSIAHLNATQMFPNRLSDDYTRSGQGDTACTANEALPYFGGTFIHQLNGLYHFNQRVPYFLVSQMAGWMLNNATLKAEGDRAFKEYIRYTVFPGGYVGSFKRWSTNNPTLGLIYAFTSFGLLVQVADVAARGGDTSLYDYTTSDGMCGSEGGTKNLLFALTSLANHVDHTFVRYGTDQSGNNGNASYIIDSVNDLTGDAMVFDHVVAQANVYYRNNYLKTIYMRTAPGQNGYSLPGYPANPWDGGYYEWGGSWGNMAGVLFMHGQIEDSAANPFTGTPPSGGGGQLELRVIRKLQ